MARFVRQPEMDLPVRPGRRLDVQRPGDRHDAVVVRGLIEQHRSRAGRLGIPPRPDRATTRSSMPTRMSWTRSRDAARRTRTYSSASAKATSTQPASSRDSSATRGRAPDLVERRPEGPLAEDLRPDECDHRSEDQKQTVWSVEQVEAGLPATRTVARTAWGAEPARTNTTQRAGQSAWYARLSSNSRNSAAAKSTTRNR